jgi:AraC-like DNA-binding protein
MSEVAEYWRHPAVPGVGLMRARFVRHGFSRHSHDTFAIGVLRAGAEDLLIGHNTHHVMVGGVVMINPDVVHTGRPAAREGWAYRVLYPTVDVLAEVSGTSSPWFKEPVVYDSAAEIAILQAHRAAETGDRLAAGTLLTRALGYLYNAYGGGRRPDSTGAHSRSVDQAREILHERLVDPPSLGELAAEVGTGQFALLRSFRARYGLPPHAYLNQQRVRQACALLEAGVPAAQVAVTVGFTDQSHLSRHFRRTIGVAPGHYQRKNVQDRHR